MTIEQKRRGRFGKCPQQQSRALRFLPIDRPSLLLLFLVLGLMLGYLPAPAWGGDRFHVAFAQDTLANDWRLAQVKEVAQALAKHPGVYFEYTDAKGNTALQAKHIDDLVAGGIDLLITSPRDRELLSMVISRVNETVPVVLLSRGIKGKGYTCFIRPDNRAIAKAAGKFISRRLNGKGRVLMLEGVPTASTAIQRSQGFLEAVEEYPGIEVVRRVGNYLRGDALLAVDRLLAAGNRFDAIFAQSDSMAIGAIMALRKQGIDPKTLTITGLDYISEARELIRSGDMAASYTYPTAGKEGAQVALEILNGRKVAKEIVLDSIEVTRDNVEDIEPIF